MTRFGSGIVRRLRKAAKRTGDAVLGRLAVWLLKGLRLTDPDMMANFAGWCARTIGPWRHEHLTGRASLAAAFPEKPPQEIENILLGVWDNLGRVAAEFAHLDRLWDYDPERKTPGRVEFSAASEELYTRLRDDGKPALIFATHLANWELPALAAAAHGIESAILFRRPNIGDIDRVVREIRSINMGMLIPTGLDAPVKIAEALERGLHVGMLVDQYYVRGVPVTFFGRKTRANPLIARLAQHVDCPIHGVRVIRLPGHRFRVELTDAVAPSRDAAGKVDIQATMQKITSIVEGWVREHPEQWLWLHRRWRPEDDLKTPSA
ncbi:MAG: lipid A biosynthesis lauroyl acyltransferase [Hyphomicrobiales bacterium]